MGLTLSDGGIKLSGFAGGADNKPLSVFYQQAFGNARALAEIIHIAL